MAGVGDPDKFSGAAKEGAVTFKEALTEWGCDPAAYKQARKAAGCFKSFGKYILNRVRYWKKQVNALVSFIILRRRRGLKSLSKV